MESQKLTKYKGHFVEIRIKIKKGDSRGELRMPIRGILMKGGQNKWYIRYIAYQENRYDKSGIWPYDPSDTFTAKEVLGIKRIQ